MKRLIAYILILITISLTATIIIVGISYSTPVEELVDIDFIGEYSTDNETWLPLEELDLPRCKNIYLRGHFNQAIENGENIWLRLENSAVQIKINEQHVFSYQKDSRPHPPIFNSTGFLWEHFSTRGISTTDHVEITVTAYYENSQNVVLALLDGFCYGDGKGFSSLIFKQFGFIGVVSLIAFFAGIMYICEGLLSIKITAKAAKRIALLGFYCLIGGLWTITDSLYPYFSIIISPPWLAGFVDMFSMLIFPIAIISLICFYLRDKTSKTIMSYVCISTVAVAVFFLVLQLAGIKDLFELQHIISFISIAQLTIAAVCIIKDFLSFRDSYLLFLILAILPVCAAIILDVINVLIPFIQKRIFMKYGIGISFIILTYQIISYAKSEKLVDKKIMQMEQQLTQSHISIMLSQIQPHFLYNALGTIRALCIRDSITARKAIEHFSKYLRGNMDSLTKKEPISFAQDLKHLENYLYIEKLRFDEKLNIVYDIKTTDFKCPPLTLQPLVENSIKHGLMKRAEGGTVCISTYELADAFCIEIKDDGVGFDKNRIYEDNKSHIGLLNTEKRIVAMCNGKLTINSEVNSGAQIIIEIPKGS